MSSSPPRSVPKGKVRSLRWALAVMAAVSLFCGLPLGFARYWNDKASREADKQISRYLTLVQEHDRADADAMLCGGDDTSLAKLPELNQPDGRLPPVESFTIVRAWDWSSAIDGHGRGYQVRLVLTAGSTADVELAVEEMADRDPCIATEILF
jgi:hypothetical protein